MRYPHGIGNGRWERNFVAALVLSKYLKCCPRLQDDDIFRLGGLPGNVDKGAKGSEEVMR